jgi:dTDP-4-amino-4,6-dideoxygalactose transaminase
MDPIMEIARRHQLWVIEDCAQAHFARYRGKYVGTFGIAATFSFYPGKNLGAMGDAGCIVTNDSSLATQMAMFARHGGLMKGDHQIEGINSRMDGLQAAILNVKLRHIQEWTRRRQAAADSYASHLAGIPDLTLPSIAQGREHVFHLYVVRTAVRDELQSALRTRGVETVINYPTALPFLPAYRYLGHRPMDFPAAFDHQSRILSLPRKLRQRSDCISKRPNPRIDRELRLPCDPRLPK